MAIRKRGFWIGLFLFFGIIILPTPAGLTDSAWLVAAVALLMVTWWSTEAIPIPVTSLLPLALFPILGVTSIETAALPYYVILDKEDSIIAEFPGMSRNVDDFIEFLESGLD